VEGDRVDHAEGRAGGVMTGVLLAFARIAGETAPLLFTALSNQFWTTHLSEPMASLPVTIFKFAMSPYENWQKLAWAGVFLITLGVLALNIWRACCSARNTDKATMDAKVELRAPSSPSCRCATSTSTTAIFRR
jgi:ABC-type phosphate transport system permease subunit